MNLSNFSRAVVVGVALVTAGPRAFAGEAGLSYEGAAWRARGIVQWEAPPAAAVKPVAGPREGVAGVATAGAPLAVSGRLADPVRDRGSLMFWLRTDRAYRSGAGAESFSAPLVEVAGVVAVSFVAERNALTLIAQWQGRREDVYDRHIRVILPEFPGPAWHHVAVSWDGPAGRLNAFIDGTPYNLPDGPREPPLAVGAATGLTLYIDRFALAEVRVASAPIAETELRNAVGPMAWGSMDTLLGVKDYGPAPQETARGPLLYSAALGAAADTRGWRLEGPGIVEHRDGWMLMKSQRSDGPEGHIVHWCPEEFPERFWAEWEFELLGEQGLCIVFFAARGHGGRDVFDPALAPRNGVFKQYHSGDIDCYHISYFANTPGSARRVANLRKNAGFYLVANGPVGVAAARPGEVHRAVLVKDGARIRMAVDGRTIIDHTDDGKRAGPVWAGGKIGLRQMQWTVGRYRNFRVYGLAPPAGADR